MKFGAFMMVKNEEERIHVSLQSLLVAVDTLIIYDTGSHDNTISIIQNFCAEHHIRLYIKLGTFIDFATSRNAGLDYMKSLELDIDFVFLLDSNDELRINSLQLLNTCFTNIPKHIETCFITLDWWAGQMTVAHRNIRCLRPSTSHRYHGVVHEYITGGEEATTIPRDVVYIYQDRVADNQRSKERFYRDRILLEKEHKEHPEDARTCYYLAQTYLCIDEDKLAFEHYKKRLELQGFHEEIYQSLFQLGKLSLKYGPIVPFTQAKDYLLQAYEKCTQAEPLVLLASYYINKKNYALAFLYAYQAINIPYPSERVLYVDDYIYDYLRFHMMGCVAFYVNEFDIGLNACKRALKTKHHVEQKMRHSDESNLKIYTDILDHLILVPTSDFVAYKDRLKPLESHWFENRDTIFLSDRRMILHLGKVESCPTGALL